ncbi:hypothetical protein OEZ85_006370 [Tetradesmus obliquus]|uniref:DNA-(apurinic or apyrimidinic site) endonuclease n=1 Tax=Tetradesmus obliquus TaxID=3088 RepID=A0ABY8TUP5_TETOB|nr:hypothetical protein OEZ85_006370 [Tetradesmus obliquus]
MLGRLALSARLYLSPATIPLLATGLTRSSTRASTRALSVMGKQDAEEGAKLTPSRRRRTKAAAEVENGNAQQEDGAAASSPKPAAKRSRTTKPKKDAGVAEAAAQPASEGAEAAAAANGEAAANGDAAAAEKPKPKRKPKEPKPPPGPLYDVSMRPPRFEGPAHRFLSWNVAGFRALIKKDAEVLKKLVALEQLDAVCLQETKLQERDVEKIVQEAGLTDWHVTFNCSTAKKGYSGTATLCREKPLSIRVGMGVEAHDDEGRVVAVELSDLWLVNAYVPNSGEGLKRLDYRVGEWDKAFAHFLKELQQGPGGKPVVLTGDLNCAHCEIDIHNPKGNLRSAGFTQEERDSFGQQVLGHAGLVDSFRQQHPGVVGYTYYSYRFNARASNRGWRLDYFLVSSDLADKVHDSYILKEITGSDHVPLGLVLKKA